MKKSNVFSFFLILLCTSGIISCSNDKVIPPNQEQVRTFSYTEDDFKITYNSSNDKNNLIVNFEIENIESGKSIKEQFKLPLDKKYLSSSVSEQITAKQIQLTPYFNFMETQQMVVLMDNMTTSVISNLSNSELRDMKTQGLFVCNSLIKSINRLASNKSKKLSQIKNYITSENIYITNTVYEGFNRDLSSFALTEDIEVSTQKLIDKINSDTLYAKQKGILVFKEMIEQKSGSIISLKELENSMLEYATSHPAEFENFEENSNQIPWPKGSDHGCCGNYSGPCYYFHGICYIHDVICTDCTPNWFCLSGCVPDEK